MELYHNGITKNSCTQLYTACLLRARYFIEVLAPQVNFTLLLEFTGNRNSAPWKALSRVSYSFTDIYLPISQCSSISLYSSFPSDKLILSSRGSCLKSWSTSTWVAFSVLAFCYLQCFSLDTNVTQFSCATRNPFHWLNLLAFHHEQHLPAFFLTHENRKFNLFHQWQLRNSTSYFSPLLSP